MEIHNKTRLISASELVSYLECPHLTALDLQSLETPLPKTDDEQTKLLQDKGFAHEAAYLERLRRNDVDGRRNIGMAGNLQGLAGGANL